MEDLFLFLLCRRENWKLLRLFSLGLTLNLLCLIAQFTIKANSERLSYGREMELFSESQARVERLLPELAIENPLE